MICIIKNVTTIGKGILIACFCFYLRIGKILKICVAILFLMFSNLRDSYTNEKKNKFFVRKFLRPHKQQVCDDPGILFLLQ